MVKPGQILTRLWILVLALLTTSCSSLSIRTVVEIDAPKEKVFGTLADFQSYPDWNPYHRRVEGEFQEGAALRVLINRPDGEEIEIPPHVMKITENEEIVWGGGIKGVFYGEHRFHLSSTPEGKTLLKHDEDFSGFAITFADLPADVIAEGYHEMNMALKRKLEDREE